MFRALVAWFTSDSGAEQDSGDAADEDESESPFLRSRLDASVLSSHGARTAKKSVQELESEAEELDAQLPDQHQQFDDPKR